MTDTAVLRTFWHAKARRCCVFREIRPGRRIWCFRSDVAPTWMPCASAHPRSGVVEVPRDPDTAEVSGWTVLMAIQHGLSTVAIAHDHALVLIRQHWSLLRDRRATLVAHLEDALRRDYPVLNESTAKATAETLEWVRTAR